MGACARAIKQADPTTKVAVSSLAGSEWTPDRLITRKLRTCLGGLGTEARYIDYLDGHHYGITATACNQGRFNDLIAPNPNCRHLRFILTEWRAIATSTKQDRCFAYALLHGKMTADFPEIPEMDWIAGIHDLHAWAGPSLCRGARTRQRMLDTESAATDQ